MIYLNKYWILINKLYKIIIIAYKLNKIISHISNFYNLQIILKMKYKILI